MIKDFLQYELPPSRRKGKNKVSNRDLVASEKYGIPTGVTHPDQDLDKKELTPNRKRLNRFEGKELMKLKNVNDTHKRLISNIY